MSGFVKIYGSILRSTVWQSPGSTRLVWLTMLILADANGVVDGSIPGLAATAGVSIEECEAALEMFLAPDRYSRSKTEGGRRIREIRGGWVVINHKYYRELRTDKQRRDAERIAERRLARHVADKATCRNVAADPDPNTDLDQDPEEEDPDRAQARDHLHLHEPEIGTPGSDPESDPELGPAVSGADAPQFAPDAARIDYQPSPATQLPPVTVDAATGQPEPKAESVPHRPPKGRRARSRAPQDPPRSLAVVVPDTWHPGQRHEARCQELGLSLPALERAFREHEFNRPYSDWDRRFSKWITDERAKAETMRAKANSNPRSTRHVNRQPDNGITLADIWK